MSKQSSPRWDAAFAVSHLGLFCLPMSHKKDVRITGLKSQALVKNCHFVVSSLNYSDSLGVPTSSDTNWAVKPQKMARGLIFRILWKKRDCTIYVATPKVLISCAVTVKVDLGVCFLICKTQVLKNSFLHFRNKGADQLHGTCAADQHLCFCYIYSSIPYLLNSKFLAYSHILCLYSSIFL